MRSIIPKLVVLLFASPVIEPPQQHIFKYLKLSKTSKQQFDFSQLCNFPDLVCSELSYIQILHACILIFPHKNKFNS